MKAFEPTIGNWWVAGRPDERVPGWLDRHPGRQSAPWRLTLHGELDVPPSPPGLVEYVNLHGETPSGLFTIMRASYREGPSGMTSAEVMRSVWDGWRLLHGGHVEDRQRYTSATFQIPGLWHWLGPAGLNAHMTTELHAGAANWKRPKLGESGEQLTAEIGQDLTVNLGPTYTQTSGRQRKSTVYSAYYAVTSTAGVEIDAIERTLSALTDLHAGVACTPMEGFDMRLATVDQQLQVVDGHRPHGRRWNRVGLADPFFDTAEINFASFIPRWIGLGKNVLAAVGAATPRDDRQFVQSKFLDACNGLEALALHKWDESTATADDVELLKRLKDCGLNGKMRDAVKRTLQMRRFPLSKKLERLAETIGEESATWLLGDPISDWATLTTDFRNSLAHGFAMDGGLADDDRFVLMAEESATAVLRLALLVEAGYVNMRSPKAGELLRHKGRKTAGHPNSQLFDTLAVVAHHSGHWRRWKSVHDLARATKVAGEGPASVVALRGGR